ncbi:Lipase, secreted [Cordyceps militaris CM01]|uniref:Lipase, secreted n=1 Tax=Cordyceps militaris (strain CM01) TaxID=983644 RepID=G3JMA7_CORMM|nr:Lipase, secreted [Cordyceps militaris CM01]EGX89995.1 Lipase, secreted [Cordyceps militaris CM01]
MKFLSLLAAVLPLASALSIPEKRVTTPANDPFYVPPAGFASSKPGTVLRERRIVAAFFGLIPDPIDARQVLYRTTAIDGSAIATVTTLFKPLFAKRDRFVAFNTAYDSSASICNPSYNYQWGALQTDIISAAEFLIIQAYLLSGYTVASADYEGPDVAFSAGRLSGMGVLDGMRAVVNYAPKIGLDKNPMIVNAGYSGGAIAGGWAASLHPTYAPELNIKGFAIGGTPANLTEVLLYVDNTLFSGFLPGAISGLSTPSAYGAQLKPVLDSIVTPHGKEVLALGASQCVVVNLVAFAGQSLFDTSIQTLGKGLLDQKDVAAVLLDTTMGLKKQETPTVPVMLYHAPDDEIIPYSGSDGLRQRWCANGANVRFTTYGAGGHATTEVIALLDALQFTSDAFSGRVPGGCDSKSVLTDKLNPLALGLSLEPTLTKLIGVLLALGQKDANWVKSISQGKSL